MWIMPTDLFGNTSFKEGEMIGTVLIFSTLLLCGFVAYLLV